MTGVAALAFAATFTSCSNGIEQYTQEEITENSYSSNFIKKYGKPASNQDWGFGAYASTRSFTRGEFANVNEYRSLFDNVPANVDMSLGGEHDKVVAEFSKQRVGATNTVNVNWTDFYVFHVDRGTETDNTYTAANGSKYYAANQMNHLQTYVNGTMEDYNNHVDGVRQEHCNNFNAANNTNVVDGIKGAMMMRNSGTVDFSYHNSVDSKYHNEYIIIAGEDIDPSLAGFYYVGFDFCATGAKGTNQDVERNWIFNDWIVRISPATFKNSARVACEDLGTTDDFDFNDVVFDVSPYQNYGYWDSSKNQYVTENYTLITVRAAGGTLPLYLQAGGVKKEVHDLFGVDRKTMVNTNNGTVSRPIAQFTVPVSVTPRSVDVIVEENAKEIVLKAEVGKVPQKICVNTTFEWCNERQQIGDKYENFPAWVQDKQVTWY